MTGTCGRCRFPLSRDHHALPECLAALQAAVAVWRPPVALHARGRRFVAFPDGRRRWGRRRGAVTGAA